MSQQIKEAWICPGLTEAQLKAWNDEYIRERNKRWGIEDSSNGISYTEEHIRIGKDKFEELAPYYDKTSAKFSLMKQAEVYNQNPAIHNYMCERFNLKSAMEWSGKV